jgi:hypothetical protein
MLGIKAFGVVERKGIEPSTFALRTRVYLRHSTTYVRFAGQNGPDFGSAAHTCRTPLERADE